MSLNGDYSSLAEAVGEAPPQQGITGDEMAEIAWDCAGDEDAIMVAVEAIDRSQGNAARAWYEANSPGTYDDGYRQACIDLGMDPDALDRRIDEGNFPWSA